MSNILEIACGVLIALIVNDAIRDITTQQRLSIWVKRKREENEQSDSYWKHH